MAPSAQQPSLHSSLLSSHLAAGPLPDDDPVLSRSPKVHGPLPGLPVACASRAAPAQSCLGLGLQGHLIQCLPLRGFWSKVALVGHPDCRVWTKCRSASAVAAVARSLPAPRFFSDCLLPFCCCIAAHLQHSVGMAMALQQQVRAILVWRGLRVAGMREIGPQRASAHCCRRQDACTEGRSAKRTLVSAFCKQVAVHMAPPGLIAYLHLQVDGCPPACHS